MVATSDVLFDNMDRLYTKIDDLAEAVNTLALKQETNKSDINTRLLALEARIPTISPKWVIGGIIMLVLAGASLGERAWSIADRWLEPQAMHELVVGEIAPTE